MGDVTRVYIRPIWTAAGYRYDVELDGQVIVARSRVPSSDAARWCAGQGKDGVLEVWRYGGSGPSMKGEISRLAQRTVTEGERQSPTFVKWRPIDKSRFDAA